MNWKKELIEKYGANPESIRDFSQDFSKSPDLLPYATILNSRINELGLVGVCEWQERPLLYLLQPSETSNDQDILSIRRKLAMRGDAPYLGVISKNDLRIYSLAVDSAALPSSIVDVGLQHNHQFALLSQLGNFRPGTENFLQGNILNILMELIKQKLRSLSSIAKIDTDISISLLYRAIFFRYLIDRELITSKSKLYPISSASPKESRMLFGSWKQFSVVNRILDRKFEAVFLPISEKVGKEGFSTIDTILSDIFFDTTQSQNDSNWSPSWSDLDFSIIPATLICQALNLAVEAFAKGSYSTDFTISHQILDFMAKTSVYSLEKDNKIDSAKILDPSVGCGNCLAAQYRWLVSSHWQKYGRPDATKLNQIMRSQLTGFGMTEFSLHATAFALRLSQLEILPELENELEFKSLRGTTLFLISKSEEQNSGKDDTVNLFGDSSHKNSYDLIIGCPNQRMKFSENERRNFNKLVDRIAHKSGKESLPINISERMSDLAYLWLAMEWCKPNGTIILALRSRFLFQVKNGMPKMRELIFNSLGLTSLLSCTKPSSVGQMGNNSNGLESYCVLFAKNQLPNPMSKIALVEAKPERGLIETNQLRLDILGSRTIRTSVLQQSPSLLKPYLRGADVDIGIFKELLEPSLGFKSFKSYWRGSSGKFGSKTVLIEAYEPDKQEPQFMKSYLSNEDIDRFENQGSCYFFKATSSEKRNLNNHAEDDQIQLEVRLSQYWEDMDRNTKEKFTHAPTVELHFGPVLIVENQPVGSNKRIFTSVSQHDILKTNDKNGRKIYAYSNPRGANSLQIIRLLALVLGSKITLWKSLFLGGRFGHDSMSIEKTALGQMQVPDIASLTNDQQELIGEFFEKLDYMTKLQADNSKVWQEIDNWVGSLYELGNWDIDSLDTSLEYDLPNLMFDNSPRKIPTPADKENFYNELKSELGEFSKQFKNHVSVKWLEDLADSPWQCFNISIGKDDGSDLLNDNSLKQLMVSSKDEPTTICYGARQKERILVGQLSELKQLSNSQARILAQKIAWKYIAYYTGKDESELLPQFGGNLMDEVYSERDLSSSRQDMDIQSACEKFSKVIEKILGEHAKQFNNQVSVEWLKQTSDAPRQLFDIHIGKYVENDTFLNSKLFNKLVVSSRGAPTTTICKIDQGERLIVSQLSHLKYLTESNAQNLAKFVAPKIMRQI